MHTYCHRGDFVHAYIYIFEIFFDYEIAKDFSFVHKIVYIFILKISIYLLNLYKKLSMTLIDLAIG